MKATQEEVRIFYQSLGKLFYAIAASDKRIEILEFEKLNELLEKRWLKTDAFKDINGNEVNQVKTIFEQLHKANSSAEKCFLEFINFKNQYPELFTKEIKTSIIKTASAIAYAFSGLNKSELIMLAKLDIELKK